MEQNWLVSIVFTSINKDHDLSCKWVFMAYSGQIDNTCITEGESSLLRQVDILKKTLFFQVFAFTPKY